jgi:hypothetical protein
MEIRTEDGRPHEGAEILENFGSKLEAVRSVIRLYRAHGDVPGEDMMQVIEDMMLDVCTDYRQIVYVVRQQMPWRGRVGHESPAGAEG